MLSHIALPCSIKAIILWLVIFAALPLNIVLISVNCRLQEEKEAKAREKKLKKEARLRAIAERKAKAVE